MSYSIEEAFQRIEEEMIVSMARNLRHHVNLEKEEGFEYTMWQAEQLAALKEYREQNKKAFSGYFSTINDKIGEVIQKAYETGNLDQEIEILEAIRKGAKIPGSRESKKLQGAFFRINQRKIDALIKATTGEMARAETAMLRMADDAYRQTIFNAATYYNTGAGTLPQCVDMATKDFLAKGINCVEYANGARVGIDSYARMALRTAQTRAYVQGEATKRDEWGVNTVIVNKRGVACPRCLKYVGKVFYDDVWGSIAVTDNKYPKLSEAIEGGLYHPNCKDIHTTYFEGINSPPGRMTKEQVAKANRVYQLEQEQRYNERQIRKYKRLALGTVDPEMKAGHQKKLTAWQSRQNDFIDAHSDVLKSRPELEKVFPTPPEITGIVKEKERLKSGESVLTNKSETDIIQMVQNYGLDTSSKQFGKKVGRHAEDYGLDPGSVIDRTKLKTIIAGIVSDYDQVRGGDWRGQDDDVLFFVKGYDVVIVNKNGKFVSILKGGVTNARVKNARIIKIR